MIQRMTDLENEAKQQLTESEQLAECPPEMAEGPGMAPAPMDQGNPVTMNISMNASGKDHVADLIGMMKNAGLGDAQPATDAMMPMRQDMERLSAMMDEPKEEGIEEGGMKDAVTDMQEQLHDFAQEIQKGMHSYDNVVDELNDMFDEVKDMGDPIVTNAFKVLRSLEPEDFGEGEGGGPNRASMVAQDAMDMIDGSDDSDYDHLPNLEGYANSPDGVEGDPDYSDHEKMTRDLSGGINREKKSYAAAQDGDNAMAVESIKEQLWAALNDKLGEGRGRGKKKLKASRGNEDIKTTEGRGKGRGKKKSRG